jgi:hypothetical protein
MEPIEAFCQNEMSLTILENSSFSTFFKTSLALKEKMSLSIYAPPYFGASLFDQFAEAISFHKTLCNDAAR